jgi:hypothetical protein
MSGEEIEITIGPDGEVNLETHGIKGAACNKVMAAFVQALGKLKSAEQTEEFFEAAIDVEVESQLDQKLHR